MTPEQAKVTEERFRTTLLARNKAYAENKHKAQIEWGGFPNVSSIAVVGCMDPRAVPEHHFDIQGPNRPPFAGIRNAGGRAPDALRSVRALMSVGGNGKLGLGVIVIVHHTDCGLNYFSREHHFERLRAEAPAERTDAELWKQVDDFGTMPDFDRSVREDMEIYRNDPIINKNVIVLGFVYDIDTGLLREVN